MRFLQITPQGNHVLVQLNRGKANPLNAEFIAELRQLVTNVNQDPHIEGVILTGQDHYFSAGLDVVELFDYDPDAIHTFWLALMDLLAEMSGSPKPWISAISGHSPAGGCVLALCCDYRVMAEGNYKIGLNEVPVGIVVPKGIYELYAQVLGARLAYQYLLEGRLMSPEQALQVGLVDDVVPLEEVVAQATVKMQQYLAFNQIAWQETKRNLRQELVAALQDRDSLVTTLEQWWAPTTRATLQGLVSRLKKS